MDKITAYHSSKRAAQRQNAPGGYKFMQFLKTEIQMKLVKRTEEYSRVFSLRSQNVQEHILQKDIRLH